MQKSEEFYQLIKNESALERATILAYESGDVLQQAKYLSWAEEGELPEGDIRIIRGKLKANLMDVLTQAWALCRLMNEEPTEWLELGCEKAISAITKRREGQLHEHVKDKW